MIGDVLFGSGDDTLTVEAGRINGAISFGDGQDALVVDGSTVHAEILRLIEDGIIDPMTDEEIWPPCLTSPARFPIPTAICPSRSISPRWNLWKAAIWRFPTRASVTVRS